MAVLVCHIGWMASYEGQVRKPDKIVGGGAYVRENNDGGETCNFLKCRDGNVYGHVETIKGDHDRPILIEHLGAKPDDDYVDHVDVVWTATDPQRKGRWVVGWYRNARVYRNRVTFKTPPSPQHRLDAPKPDFRIQAKAANAHVIPPAKRKIALGRGKGWIGQANWWFPAQSPNPAVKTFLRKVKTLFEPAAESDEVSSQKRGGGNWGGKGDLDRKALVEKAATDAVRAHFSGYRIKSVEKDNVGWDLEAKRKGRATLLLEVKGLFGGDLQVGITPGEYRALQAHKTGKMPHYRLCVVTRALSNSPTLVIFRYDVAKRRWIDDNTGRTITPEIKPIIAAIISLDYLSRRSAS